MDGAERGVAESLTSSLNADIHVFKVRRLSLARPLSPRSAGSERLMGRRVAGADGRVTSFTLNSSELHSARPK